MSSIAERKTSNNENGDIESAQRSKNMPQNKFLKKQAFGEIKNLMTDQDANTPFKNYFTKIKSNCISDNNAINRKTQICNDSEEIGKNGTHDELDLSEFNCGVHFNKTYTEIWSEMNMINERILKSVLCNNDNGISMENEVIFCKKFDSMIDLPEEPNIPLIGNDFEILVKFIDDSLLIPNIEDSLNYL